MSRSRRPTPIRGVAGDSDKWDKVRAHRQLRVAERAALAAGDFDQLPDEKTFGDPWASNKDGKLRIEEAAPDTWDQDEWTAARRKWLAK